MSGNNFLNNEFLIGMALYILFSSGVFSILTFFDKKNTAITNAKACFCKIINTKHRRIGVVIIICIIAIAFAKFYTTNPIQTGIITGLLSGIVLFFKETTQRKQKQGL